MVKAEVCGAVYAACLKKYFQKHCRIHVGKWYHLVDSQTVLGAIQRESYGYQTFFANWIGEIKQHKHSGLVVGPRAIKHSWRYLQGASPQDVGEGSDWQRVESS